MIRWAIRHKPTNGYMPEVGPKMGYTGSEPTDMGEGSAHCPRLFASEGAAKRALTWWLKGVTSRTYTGGGHWMEEVDEHWETFMPEVDKEWMVKRKAEDMEVVCLDFWVLNYIVNHGVVVR